MAATDLVNLSSLIDDAKCFAMVRQHRWPTGVRCPACSGAAVVRYGCDDTQPHRQRYRCKTCAGRFDDLTGTVVARQSESARATIKIRERKIEMPFAAASRAHRVLWTKPL